ncbi:dual OB domain-containing protein [Sphingobacterium sp. SG20118]|uniref:dual OB domain-containing protein n=1 Tax=Sphingobacterium sp. SG20118 TaxID=3367156 RepID=UPI0037DFC586
MDVIIVSKTRMANAFCIGGILDNGRAVRLLNQSGNNQDTDTEIKVGDVYSITFTERKDKKPPHIEDVLVNTLVYKSSFQSIKKMVDYLFENVDVKFWAGDIDKLYDGKLQWTKNGSGYICEARGVPENSVGFWMSNRELRLSVSDIKPKYKYILGENKLAYVGLQEPVEIIPLGTLVRVSLARWWSPDSNEKRCYLQLSGWYI